MISHADRGKLSPQAESGVRIVDIIKVISCSMSKHANYLVSFWKGAGKECN